jgi:hypothetical protein
MNAVPQAGPAIPLQSFVPTTFLQRGVRMPFTSPGLISACARPSDRALELVLPNMSGGAGMYILPWNGVSTICRPTMHDMVLIRRVSELKVITPSVIRRVARGVAAEGLAGREAALAARAETGAEASLAVATNFLLVLELVRQTETQGPSWIPPERDRPANIEARARTAIATVAARLNSRPDELASRIEELANVLSGLGIGPQMATARVPKAVAALERLQNEVSAWRLGEGEGSEEARMLADSAALTRKVVREVLRELRKQMADLPSLVLRWLTDPGKLSQVIARPEWLLDGWERIWMLWDTAEESFGRAAVVVELLGLLPIVPAEVRDWAGVDIEAERAGMRARRMVTSLEDWRTGAILADLVVRNEHLRALSPGGPA